MPAITKTVVAPVIELVVAPIVTPIKAKPIYTSSQAEANAKIFIYNKESGNNPEAINSQSGACGLAQALPCSKLPCTLQDYNCQDAFFTSYAISRYGSWIAAKYFWDNHKWW